MEDLKDLMNFEDIKKYHSVQNFFGKIWLEYTFFLFDI